MTRTRTSQNKRTQFVWTDEEDNQMREIFDEYPGISARQAGIMFLQRNPNYAPNWRVYRKALDMSKVLKEEKELKYTIRYAGRDRTNEAGQPGNEPVDTGEQTIEFGFTVNTSATGTLTATTLEEAKRRVFSKFSDFCWNVLHVEVYPVETRTELGRTEIETD